MRGRALIFVLAALLPSSLAAAAAPAQAPPSPTPCPSGFTCGTLTVLLDRSGQTPGTITLHIERKLVGSTPSRDAVLALAGGPGQPALGLAGFIAKAIAPALAGRDLIVFDQRGTGESDPLNCAAFGDPRTLAHAGAEDFAMLTEQCALQIGSARAAFTSEESVQDIEAIRAAFGYEKLVLYGTSYGTKVALRYAEREPQRVEALVLDSVVAADGPDPFSLPTFQAIRPAISELCSAHACARISPSPYGELTQLATRLRAHSLRGFVYDGSGRRFADTLSETELLGILQAGDLNPALRALLPAAVHSALHNDPDPLLRLSLLSEGLIPNVPESPTQAQEASEEGNALFFATSCEEKPFPWQRAAPAAVRRSEALAALRALPPADFKPFDANTALAASLVPICASWPDASAAPPATVGLPDVPTLILSGAQDLRTPTATARKLAASIPAAQLLVVPHTGHSVLGTDFSGCAQAAVKAFFAGSHVQACRSSTDVFKPTPVTPTRLASVHPVPGVPGTPGRTLTAVLDTIVDLSRQVTGAILQAQQELPSGASFGGLHGGYARLTASSVRLHDLTFVPGVQLTGTFPVRGGRLQTATVRVDGSSAASGSVRLGSGTRVTGTLGGTRFAVSIANVKLSSASAPAVDWRRLDVRFPMPGLARVR